MGGLRYEAAWRTHPGKVRPGNEDHAGSRSLDGGLALVVTDGMAQLAGGEVASQVAAEALLNDLTPDVLSLGEEPQLEALVRGIEAAHRALGARQEQEWGLTGMGTTVVAALLGPELVAYQYAGDSRLYWLRDGEVLRVTRDHSVVQALVELGRLQPDETEGHPMAGKLTSFLGGSNHWERIQLSPGPKESASFVPRPGDVVLMCSDGVYTELTDEHLAVLACGPGTAGERADRVLEAVLATEARDNATVALAVVG